MEAIVEFQGFKDNSNRFIVKELAVVGEYFQTQIIFDPPYNFNSLNSKMQRTARWLSRHFHHIKWDDNGVPYDEQIIYSLCKPFTVIYTKGLEKVQFLNQFHHDVREISWDRGGSCEVKCMLSKHNVPETKCALRCARSFWDGL